MNNANYYKFTAGLYAPVDTVHFVGVTEIRMLLFTRVILFEFKI